MKERIEKSGKFRLFAIPEPYQGKHSFVAIECVNCRMITIGKAAQFYPYKYCVHCGKKTITKKRQSKPIEHYTKRTELFNKTLLNILDDNYHGSRTNCLWKCNICGHIWESILNEASRAHGCISCRNTNISINQTISIEDATNRLKSQGVSIERWLGEYKGNSTRALLNCDKCGYVWTAKVNQVQKEYSCPSCSQTKTRYLYLQKLSVDSNPVAIKFGIANNVKKRMLQQDRHSIFDHEITRTFYFDDGNAGVVESAIKDNFNCRFVSEKDMPDGFTETIDYQDLEDLIEFIQNEL